MKNSRAHFQMVKRHNKKLIRNILRNSQTIGVSELTKETGLSYPTVANLIKELIQDNEVIEVEETVSNGGRPAAQYRLNPEYKYGVVMNLSPKVIKYVVVDVLCNEVERGKFDVTDDKITPEDLISHVSYIKKKYDNLASLALGIPGVAIEDDIRFLDLFPELEGTKLSRRMREELGVRMVAENDSNAMALAEIRGEESFAHIVYVGHCVGCGIVINGELFRGCDGYAGEIHPICEHLDDPVLAMVETIKFVTGVLNLKRVYISADCDINPVRVTGGLKKIFEKDMLPEIEFVKDADKVYIEGLIERLLIIWREEIE